jgi:hypothetical protein
MLPPLLTLLSLTPSISSENPGGVHSIRCECHTPGTRGTRGAEWKEIQRPMSGFCGVLSGSIRDSAGSDFVGRKERDFTPQCPLTGTMQDSPATLSGTLRVPRDCRTHTLSTTTLFVVEVRGERKISVCPAEPDESFALPVVCFTRSIVVGDVLKSEVI